MKEILIFITVLAMITLQTQTQTKPKVRYETIIVKHITKPAVKKTTQKPVEKTEMLLPVPEYINQPYYYKKDGNKLIQLENTAALLITIKKTFRLKGVKQLLSINDPSSKISFTAKKDIVFFIKTSGDVIDLTSYIKLYLFFPDGQKREATINTKEGLLNDKDEAKGKLISLGVKMISKNNYMT